MRIGIVATSLLAFAAVPTTVPAAPTVSAGIVAQLPSGHVVISRVALRAGSPLRDFQIIALRRRDEPSAMDRARTAPPRPLVIFERRGGRFVLSGRNDHVVMRADEGGQCDPFLDGDASIAVRGRFFTVENGVACGQHWTDLITFRLDDRAGFVFDNERTESWSLNPSDAPGAEAMVRDGPQRVRRDQPGRTTRFADWRPAR